MQGPCGCSYEACYDLEAFSPYAIAADEPVYGCVGSLGSGRPVGNGSH